MKTNTENLIKGNSAAVQVKLKRFIKEHGYYNLPMFFRAHIYFIYRYYLRFGFLDGTEGKIYTFLQAYWYRYLVDAKIFECEKQGVVMNKQGTLETSTIEVVNSKTVETLIDTTNMQNMIQKKSLGGGNI